MISILKMHDPRWWKFGMQGIRPVRRAADVVCKAFCLCSGLKVEGTFLWRDLSARLQCLVGFKTGREMFGWKSPNSAEAPSALRIPGHLNAIPRLNCTGDRSGRLRTEL